MSRYTECYTCYPPPRGSEEGGRARAAAVSARAPSFGPKGGRLAASAVGRLFLLRSKAARIGVGVGIGDGNI